MADFVFVDKEKEKKKKLIRTLIIACIPVLILAGFGVKYLLSFTGAENTAAAAVVKSADVTASQEIETGAPSETAAPVTQEQTYTLAPETEAPTVYTTYAPATQADRVIAGENSDTASPSSRAVSPTHTAPAVREPGESYSYVLNTNTMRIHYPYCHSVDQMADKNKAYSDKSVAELKAEGYVPCGNCKPY